MVKAPKVFIRDSGLLHSLLGIGSMDDLLGRPLVGHSWEGFVIEQIIAQLPPRWEAYFFRTAAGAEIDLILAHSGREPVAVEIKYSATPEVSRGFRGACLDLQCSKAYVVYPGSEAYPLGKTITALPLLQIRRIVNDLPD